MPYKNPEDKKEYNRKAYEKRKLEGKIKSSKNCEHNRQKSNCKDCGGCGICKHNRRKLQCKECRVSQICEHNRRRSRCKDCGGCGICEHNRHKSICKDCGGGGICEHNRRRSRCKDCVGGSICEHNRLKSICKDCSLQTYLIDLQRHALKRILKHTSIQKVKHTVKYLGCDSEYFMEYIIKNERKYDI